MRIAAYIHPKRVGPQPSGVGKHIGNMAAQLGKRSDLSVCLLACENDWNAFTAAVPASPLRDFEVKTIGCNRALLEKAWSTFAFPNAETWTGPADWIYLPMEAYVPTAHARLAVTCHCMNWFEPSLPWYGERWCRIERLRWRWRIGRLFKQRDVILLSVSQFLKRRLVELFGLAPERIFVVGNGVEPYYFDIGHSPMLSYADDPPYLLVVGGLTYRKGGDRVLELASRLKSLKKDVQIWIAGSSDPSLAAEALKHSNVRALGYVGADTGLPMLMKRAVAVYFPSRYETFGIPAAEAMAAGVPVIVSNEAALPEIVGAGGIVVEPTDFEATISAVERLMNDSNFRREVIGRGLRESKRHTWEACCDRLLASLREVKDGRKP